MQLITETTLKTIRTIFVSTKAGTEVCQASMAQDVTVTAD